jgi:hypothetical protein
VSAVMGVLLSARRAMTSTRERRNMHCGRVLTVLLARPSKDREPEE